METEIINILQLRCIYYKNTRKKKKKNKKNCCPLKNPEIPVLLDYIGLLYLQLYMWKKNKKKSYIHRDVYIAIKIPFHTTFSYRVENMFFFFFFLHLFFVLVKKEKKDMFHLLFIFQKMFGHAGLA